MAMRVANRRAGTTARTPHQPIRTLAHQSLPPNQIPPVGDLRSHGAPAQAAPKQAPITATEPISGRPSGSELDAPAHPSAAPEDPSWLFDWAADELRRDSGSVGGGGPRRWAIATPFRAIAARRSGPARAVGSTSAAVPVAAMSPSAERSASAVATVPGSVSNRTRRVLREGLYGGIALATVLICVVAFGAFYHSSTGDRKQASTSVPTVSHPGTASSSLSSSPPAPEAPLPVDAPRRAAVRWIQVNVAKAASIAGDAATSAELSRAGYRRVHRVGSGTDLARIPVEYAVLEGSRSALPPALKALQRHSVNVAVFGTGAARTTVCAVVPGGSGAVTTLLANNRKARMSAGQQLSVNPHLSSGPEAAAVLGTGSLDLRAATLVALLTQSVAVQLESAPQSVAERAAGLPVRTIRVTVPDVTMARAVIAGLPEAYRASSVRSKPGNGLLVQWPVQGIPTPPIG